MTHCSGKDRYCSAELCTQHDHVDGCPSIRRQLLRQHGVAAAEQVVLAFELAAAIKQIKELGKKTMEAELLPEAADIGRQKSGFAKMLDLKPKTTVIRSLENNGMAESFVKTMKRDCISIMPKLDGMTVVKYLAEAFEHDNEWHPHSSLGYRLPREYLWRRTE